MISYHRLIRKVTLYGFYICCIIVWKDALNCKGIKKDVKGKVELSMIVTLGKLLYCLIVALEQYLGIKSKGVESGIRLEEKAKDFHYTSK